ncbi:MAG: GH1 family beta-glucosidase [Bacteroidota bacterium]|nr:GH1 family beta-glucosidase [Bacteroidota bacterium]MDP4217849.1 GH1 family beta-glucosidase [Bacteroidota bacterium]MDP4247697.1 GH1 family beta-glucosidase [Bacteroidota bacterium]MDP4255401.1 GH1 family beta-glucosidase [Bacteroidota bacterium]MDP4257745.1 GH1 family beta-glucosidase [Bacteroidota bacterium]
MTLHPDKWTAKDFGEDFIWGVAMAAAQNEGAANSYGKGPSIWDNFSRRRGKIRDGARPAVACDFYHRYKDDLLLAKALGFTAFRFSISWPRILPEGIGTVNKEGIAFYHRVIDECLHLGLTPYVTLYHWDLPAALEKEGGWSSHLMGKWFNRYVTLCAEEYGAKVKDWIVLNEPFGFTSLGYMLGRHAPGRMAMSSFLSAVHHAALAQADGGRILRKLVPGAHIGTTFSCSEVIPYTQSPEDLQAAKRLDILMNRLFIEPTLGKGYPREDFRLLERLELHNKAWKYTDRMAFDFDFIGIQNYFPTVVRHNSLIPVIQASEVKARTRKVPHTAMGWEINPGSFQRILSRFWRYGGVKKILVTESGAAFRDSLVNGVVDDYQRIEYYRAYLHALLMARAEGVNIKGFFAWTLMDNFEWAEGFRARFGLIHVDFATQLRTIKGSGYWFRDLLNAP